MIFTIGIGIGALFIAIFLFIKLSPQFGGKVSKQAQLQYSLSDNFKDGKFINLGNVSMDMSAADMWKAIRGMLKSYPNTRPKEAIQVQKMDSLNLAEYEAKTRMFWFGHSTFLLQIKGKNVLIDPMFGSVPAPNPMLGEKRFSSSLPIEIKNLPSIDAVILSHDHYDHLDYGSIQKLKDKVEHFYTPLGVGAHLEQWGIEKERITELDWWQEAVFEDLKFVCAPAQHFSGRGLSDRASTLWSSWIIQSDNDNLYFSGDSGYGNHFKDIGEKYGPFDFAMLECGQYNKLWPEVHMFPEETAQAGVDVQAKIVMPIHWGAFKLSQHTWTDPVERLTKKASELGLTVITPQIGEAIMMDTVNINASRWWSLQE